MGAVKKFVRKTGKKILKSVIREGSKELESALVKNPYGEFAVDAYHMGKGIIKQKRKMQRQAKHGKALEKVLRDAKII